MSKTAHQNEQLSLENMHEWIRQISISSETLVLHIATISWLVIACMWCFIRLHARTSAYFLELHLHDQNYFHLTMSTRSLIGSHVSDYQYERTKNSHVSETDSCSTISEVVGVFGNHIQFDPIGQTAEKRVGKWAEFGLIAPIAFGNTLDRLVSLIGLRTLTVLFLYRLTYANVAIRISGKGLLPLETPTSLAVDVGKCAERSDRSDTTLRTLGHFHTVLYRSVWQNALSERTLWVSASRASHKSTYTLRFMWAFHAKLRRLANSCTDRNFFPFRTIVGLGPNVFWRTNESAKSPDSCPRRSIFFPWQPLI
jgi:hypothetical protein